MSASTTLLPKFKTRPINVQCYEQLCAEGVEPVLANIVAARPMIEGGRIDPIDSVYPQLSKLDHPTGLPDIEAAVTRIVSAIETNQVIGIETDHDCDGQTSHAVIYLALTQWFKVPVQNIRSYIGHRLEEGYGLSDKLCARILQDEVRPQLVITADNGSTDEPRIATLKAENIDVIVTDHHTMPESGAPLSAVACVNPTRENSAYPDPYIAGCMVAWLLMAAVRKRLLKLNLIAADTPSLAGLLDFVAVGTVADCVSLARSHNNRAVVHYGLKLIRQKKRPCWQAVATLLPEGRCINSTDLGFVIGPLLNSDGRLSDAMGSVNFLLATDLGQASQWAQQLWDQNQKRKGIQNQLQQQAMRAAKEQVASGKSSICIFLAEGHAGVHGIVASRIKDTFGRPTIIFSPKQGNDALITGSARSIDSVHIRDVLQRVSEQAPDVLSQFGGHKGAAGLSLNVKDFAAFSHLFEDTINAVTSETDIGPVVWLDKPLPADDVNLQCVRKLQMLGPFGREFDIPTFSGNFVVRQCQPLGKTGLHLRLKLELDTRLFSAVWFSPPTELLDMLEVGQTYCFAYRIDENFFRGVSSLQLQVVGLEAID